MNVDSYVKAREKELGEKLRIELARRGMTSADLHERSGVSLSQISQIRNAKANPKFETLCRLEYALTTRFI